MFYTRKSVTDFKCLAKCSSLIFLSSVHMTCSLVWSRTGSTPSQKLKSWQCNQNKNTTNVELKITGRSTYHRIFQNACIPNFASLAEGKTFQHWIYCVFCVFNDLSWEMKNLGSKFDSKLSQVQRSEERKWWWSQYGSLIPNLTFLAKIGRGKTKESSKINYVVKIFENLHL